MEISDKAVFAETLQHIAECFPHGKMTDERIDAYYRHLKQFDITVIRRCIKRSVNDFDRMPSAGQLYRLINGESGGGAGGVLGWRETQRMLRETHGDDYYAKDYALGVKLGTNRPVREVLVDEIERGWRDPEDLKRHDMRSRSQAQEPLFDNTPKEAPKDKPKAMKDAIAAVAKACSFSGDTVEPTHVAEQFEF